jgi:hypothetical protein
MLGGTSATWFPFRDDDFDAFVKDFEAQGSKFSRIELKKMPIRMSVPGRVLDGSLSTYCFFYPFGAGNSGQDKSLKTPMAIIQQFAIRSEEKVKVFESGLVSIPDSAESIALQTLHSGFAEAVKAVLDPTFESYRSTVSETHHVYEKLLGEKIIQDSYAEALRRTDPDAGDDPDEGITPAEEEFYEYVPRVVKRCRQVIDEVSPDWFEEMRSQSQIFYAQLLFPTCRDREGLLTNKLDFLSTRLAAEDMDTLRVWLLYGAVLSRERAYTPEPGEEVGEIRGTVERIRSVCLEHLGIPMVAFDGGTQKVILDILPPPIH